MNTLIEAAEIAGMGLACALAGGAIAISLMSRKTSIAKARRVARSEARGQTEWFQRGVSLRLTRLEGDGRAHEMALNTHGLMEGKSIVARATIPLAIHRPDDESEGGSAA